MTRKAKRAVAITMLSIILIGLAFCISALAVSSVNGTTFTATVTEWWGVVVKAFSPSTDKPGVDKPGVDKPGIDKPGTDNPGEDKPDTDKPGTDNPGEDNSSEGTTAVCYDENGNLLKSGVRYAFQNSLNFAEASASATDGVTMTATIIPASALDKRVNWSVEWVDSTSDWAKGKTVTDYVTVTADTTDSRIATVNCSAPFGSQIKVVATSAVNEQATANCLVDYYKKGNDISMKLIAKYQWGLSGNGQLVKSDEYDVFFRTAANTYIMSYIDQMDREYYENPSSNAALVYGIEYSENYVDNSIGTKEGLSNIKLNLCKATTALQEKLKEKSITIPTNLYASSSTNDLSSCRIKRLGDSKVDLTRLRNAGPTFDYYNIKNCLGYDFNDAGYEEFVRALQEVSNAGDYHFEYVLSANDVLTGTAKEIIINVSLDTTFIPVAMRVELDKNSVGF